jgi:hypothetical protein
MRGLRILTGIAVLLRHCTLPTRSIISFPITPILALVFGQPLWPRC